MKIAFGIKANVVLVATLALASSVIDFTHNCGLSMLPNCICPMSDATAATTTATPATGEEEQKKLHIKLNIKLRGERTENWDRQKHVAGFKYSHNAPG